MSSVLTSRELHLCVNNLMMATGINDPVAAVRSFNAGKWELKERNTKLPPCGWREKDGIIDSAVVSTNNSGPEWVRFLEQMGCNIEKRAANLVLNADFNPCPHAVHSIVILKNELFSDNDLNSKAIRKYASEQLNLMTPDIEVGCLICRNFTDTDIEAMGLTRIVTMHAPISDAPGRYALLSARRDGAGRSLFASDGSPNAKWDRGCGFAFTVSIR